MVGGVAAYVVGKTWNDACVGRGGYFEDYKVSTSRNFHPTLFHPHSSVTPFYFTCTPFCSIFTSLLLQVYSISL